MIDFFVDEFTKIFSSACLIDSSTKDKLSFLSSSRDAFAFSIMAFASALERSMRDMDHEVPTLVTMVPKISRNSSNGPCLNQHNAGCCTGDRSRHRSAWDHARWLGIIFKPLGDYAFHTVLVLRTEYNTYSGMGSYL